MGPRYRNVEKTLKKSINFVYLDLSWFALLGSKNVDVKNAFEWR